MTIKSTELDEADFQAIVALALKKSQDEAGAWICTAQLPTGMTGRALRARMQLRREAYDRLTMKIATAINRKQEQFEEITKQKYLDKLAALRSKGIAVKEKALDEGLDGVGDLALAVKVADSIEERDFGRPNQIHKIEGDVNVNHKMVWQPERILIEQEHDIQNSAKLLTAIPQDALEAELVDSN